jgi:hypothetical protein
MLQTFIADWQAALNNRMVTNRYARGGQTNQQCVVRFRETEIITTEVWSNDPQQLVTIKLFVPSTGKFIPRSYIEFTSVDWTTMAGILNALTMGKANENKLVRRRKMWIEQNAPTILNELVSNIVKTKKFTEEEIQLFSGILKSHIESDNIIRAKVISDVLVKYVDVITATDLPNERWNEDDFIDRMYSMVASIVDKRYYLNNQYTINQADCNFMFMSDVSHKVPPIYAFIRKTMTQIYHDCKISSNFVYFAEMLCLYYAKITCVPYEVKMAEIRLKDQQYRERKKRRFEEKRRGAGMMGTIGEMETAAPLNDLELE